MLAKRIIPCLDVTDGRVVKGTKFLNLRDAGDPVECAKMYDAQGADELVFLDITASSDGRATMLSVVERTAEQCFMPLTVGGGIRSVNDFRIMLRAGADKVSVNTSALQRPELISEGAEAFGSQCVVVAVDAKRDGPGYGLIDIELGILNDAGKESTPGTATVALPYKNGKPVPYPFVPPAA